jgi:hypothetical protein
MPHASLATRALRADRRRAYLLAIALLGIVGATASGCTGKDPYNPGTPLGTYHVVGKLLANECGAAGSVDGAPPATWEFDVRLSRDQSTLYWVQGGLPVQGQLDAHAHAKMVSSDTRKIHDANPKQGVAYCGITRSDGLDVTMNSDDAFVGTLAYSFSASDGSDCTDQLSTAGGAFAALPCTTRYDLSGARTALPKPKH